MKTRIAVVLDLLRVSFRGILNSFESFFIAQYGKDVEPEKAELKTAGELFETYIQSLSMALGLWVHSVLFTQ